MLFDTKPFDLPTAFDKGYAAAFTKPLDMLIFCPNCGMQHVDLPKLDICSNCRIDVDAHDGAGCDTFTPWLNPPHKSHKCRTEDNGCGLIFRIADVPTNGVAQIKTKGKDDTWWVATPDDLPAGYRRVKSDETIKEKGFIYLTPQENSVI